MQVIDFLDFKIKKFLAGKSKDAAFIKKLREAISLARLIQKAEKKGLDLVLEAPDGQKINVTEMLKKPDQETPHD